MPDSASSGRIASAIPRSRPASARRAAGNTDAFASAPQFTIGSSSRNPVRGLGYRTVDLAVMRRVPVGGHSSLELRAELFNATNAPPLGNPNGIFGTPAFGTMTSAGDPRVIQLAVKVHF